MWVVVGSEKKYGDVECSKCMHYRVQNWNYHRDYNPRGKIRDQVSDVGMILLKKDIDFTTPRVKPIALDIVENFVQINDVVTLVGFGKIEVFKSTCLPFF